MHRLAFTVVGFVALVACGSSDSDKSTTGSAPTTKQAAAQDVAQTSSIVSEALSTALSATPSTTGGTTTKAVGIHFADIRIADNTVSFSGNCPGGGTVALTLTESDGTDTTTTNNASASYTLTTHTCKTSSGDVIDGGPLTVAIAVDSSGDTDGGVNGSLHEKITYSGAISVTGKINETVVFNNLSIDVSVSVATSGGTVTGTESVVYNGSVTIDNETFAYVNESFDVTFGG